ncbi:MAG: hypothetical protein J7M14_07425 [Planctomycetes bacterium]|nr:hypothetical protein [Planctomycetota bacterium]
MAKVFDAQDIQIGLHPDGYRIDKTASPMNRYTKWEVSPDGQWENPTAVCFDSMPARGWRRCEGFDWD